MKTAFETLALSNVWDKRFDLPTVPIHLNPHIYFAYVIRVLQSQPKEDSVSAQAASMLRGRYLMTFLRPCEVKPEEPGLITTFPDRPGVASVDDLHGAAFLHGPFAAACLAYLQKHDGSYTDGEDSELKNDYRFLFFKPALQAHAGYRVGIITQVQFVLALLGNLLFTPKGSTDGHLLLWLAFPAMRKYPLANAFIDWWAGKQTTRGLTPKRIFQTYYLTECPWFGDWARDDWS